MVLAYLIFGAYVEKSSVDLNLCIDKVWSHVFNSILGNVENRQNLIPSSSAIEKKISVAISEENDSVFK